LTGPCPEKRVSAVAQTAWCIGCIMEKLRVDWVVDLVCLAEKAGIKPAEK
jgi:hypothetical protein